METCICAAVRYQDKVWYGHRHAGALEAMRDELSWYMNRQELTSIHPEQGFVTTRGRFVNRREAYDIQVAAGRKSVDTTYGYRGKELYSEDLY